MSPNETGGAEPSRRRRHASKRRGPGPLWIAGSGAVVACGVLAAFAALDGGPVSGGGGPGPDEGRPGMPALIQRDAGSSGGDGDGGPTADPSASGGSASPSATAGTAGPSAGPTPSGGATSPGPAPSGSGTASPSGRPGYSDQAPGIQKKPR
ncbi:hypothetical protein ACFY8W_08780 [Streptomyces sp. NPDC012637]|uniref:hypothetical protein n=1 Tax=Streptomyces sp. NPDC012637 TaxID=3364842 RepID=UPI0036E3D862